MSKYEMTDKQVTQRLALLNRVKQLFLLPVGDVLTIKQMADYFEVSINKIKKLYESEKEEFDEAGVCVKYPQDFKIFNDPRVSNYIRKERGNLIFKVNDTTDIIIPNRGILCFTRRAVALAGMLLEDGRVSREFRNQILNYVNNLFPNNKEAEAMEEEKEFLIKLASDFVEKRISHQELLEEILEYKSKHFVYYC